MRTYLDSCTLIAAYQGNHAEHQKAMEIIDDPDRQFVSSLYLHLELLPKPSFHNQAEEVEWLKTWLDATDCVMPTEAIGREAIELAARYDLSPVDALHASVCVSAGVEDFVTIEKATKPLLRAREANVRTLRNE